MKKHLSQIPTPENLGFSTARLPRITTYLQGCVDRGEIPGYIATVARQGETAYYHTYR